MLKTLRGWFQGGSGGRRKHARRFRPTLELLESRLAPAATRTWLQDPPGVNGNYYWKDGVNWMGGVAPTLADDVVIRADTTHPPTVSESAACNKFSFTGDSPATEKVLTIVAGEQLTFAGLTVWDKNWSIGGQGTMVFFGDTTFTHGRWTVNKVDIGGVSVRLHKYFSEIISSAVCINKSLGADGVLYVSDSAEDKDLDGNISLHPDTRFEVGKTCVPRGVEVAASGGQILFMHEHDSDARGGFTGGGKINVGDGTVRRFGVDAQGEVLQVSTPIYLYNNGETGAAPLFSLAANSSLFIYCDQTVAALKVDYGNAQFNHSSKFVAYGTGIVLNSGSLNFWPDPNAQLKTVTIESDVTINGGFMNLHGVSGGSRYLQVHMPDRDLFINGGTVSIAVDRLNRKCSYIDVGDGIVWANPNTATFTVEVFGGVPVAGNTYDVILCGHGVGDFNTYDHPGFTHNWVDTTLVLTKS